VKDLKKSYRSFRDIVGILFVVIDSYAGSPLVLAAIIGAFLIIAGIVETLWKFEDFKFKIRVCKVIGG